MSRSLIRPSLRACEPYRPGLSIEEIRQRYALDSVIKLASNENPLGVSPQVLRALEGPLQSLHRYPQGGSPRLRQALGDYHGVPADRIVAGNGSDEIIDLLIRVAVEPGRDHVLAFRPCFKIYELQAHLCGVPFRQIGLRPDFTPPFAELSAAVNEETAMVFLTSPDNPSGYAPPLEEVLAFQHRLPAGCLLVLDEAYMDFALAQERYTLLPLAGQVPNLVVLRTFSKLYGLAGLRLGYGIMAPELADCLLRVKLPFSVNSLAEAAGLAALEDEAFRQATLRLVTREREAVTGALEKEGFRVYPSQANFLLLKPPMDAAELFERLLRRGIIVRPLSSYGLADHLRISIGNVEENRRLLTAIREILARPS